MLNNQDYQLQPLTQKDLQEVLEFLSTHYVANQPMTVHLGIQPQQFSQAYKNLTSQCCSSGVSFCFRLSTQIVAVFLAMPLKGYLEPFGAPQKLKPIQVIIQTIEKMYEPENVEKTLSIFIACTHPLHMGKGLFTRLIKENEKKAIQEGYIQIFVECTSKKSESPFVKSGYQQKARIGYENFQFEGCYPFKGIKNTQSLCSLTKNINQKLQ